MNKIIELYELRNRQLTEAKDQRDMYLSKIGMLYDSETLDTIVNKFIDQFTGKLEWDKCDSLELQDFYDEDNDRGYILDDNGEMLVDYAEVYL